MVRTPYIYGSVEAPCEFVAVIGDIRREIGRVAVPAYKNLVLKTEFFNILGAFALFGEALREYLRIFVPERAVLFVGEVFAFENLDCFAYFAAFVQGALVEPGVVLNAVFLGVNPLKRVVSTRQ